MNQSTEILILILLIFTAAVISTACLKQKEPTYSNEALPDPILTENSVELCLNSRVSYHDGYKGRALDRWLSNVLWAAGSAPITGDYRDIYVTTPSEDICMIRTSVRSPTGLRAAAGRLLLS